MSKKDNDRRLEVGDRVLTSRGAVAAVVIAVGAGHAGEHVLVRRGSEEWLEYEEAVERLERAVSQPTVGDTVLFHYVSRSWERDAEGTPYEATIDRVVPAIVLREPYQIETQAVWPTPVTRPALLPMTVVIDVMAFRPSGAIFFEGVPEGEAAGHWSRRARLSRPSDAEELRRIRRELAALRDAPEMSLRNGSWFVDRINEILDGRARS